MKITNHSSIGSIDAYPDRHSASVTVSFSSKIKSDVSELTVSSSPSSGNSIKVSFLIEP